MGNTKSKLFPRSKGTRRSHKKNKDPFPESSSAQKTVDPRLPFTNYRQVFNLRNSWKSVSRSLEDTAKTNLLLFLQKFPVRKDLFPKLKELKTEEDMRNDIGFENQAVAILTVFDEVMEHIETLDKAVYGLQVAARAHAAIPGFNIEFFSDMEETFIEAVSQALGERFTEPTEDNFRKFYGFVTNYMVTELRT